MSNSKIVEICADSEGLRVQLCRVGRNLKIVLSKLCACPEPHKTLVHIVRNVDLAELEAVPALLDVHIDDAHCELSYRRRRTGHSHEKENASTKGLRVRS